MANFDKIFDDIKDQVGLDPEKGGRISLAGRTAEGSRAKLFLLYKSPPVLLNASRGRALVRMRTVTPEKIRR